MKPARINISRTKADTDLIGLILEIENDEGTTKVADDAIVKLRVNDNPVIEVTGSAKGDNSGTFYFATTSLVALEGNYSFEVEVDDGTYTYVIGYGVLNFKAKI